MMPTATLTRRKTKARRRQPNLKRSGISPFLRHLQATFLPEADTTTESTNHGTVPDAMSAWAEQLRKRPLLTAEQEKELAKRIEQGDEEARRLLIESNLRLVVSIARKFRGYDVPFEDLIQEGNIGLMQAVDCFDWRRGTRFSTHATLWIRQAIIRCIQRESRLIRLPMRVSEQLHQLMAVQSALTQKLGREPDAPELAKELKMPVSEVAELQSYLTQTVTSLDEPIEGQEGELIPTGESIPDDSQEHPEAVVEREELKTEIQRALNELPPRYRTAVSLRFGLEDGQERTYEVIGKRLGLTRQRAMQIVQLALRRLRDLIRR